MLPWGVEHIPKFKNGLVHVAHRQIHGKRAHRRICYYHSFNFVCFVFKDIYQLINHSWPKIC